MQESQLLVFGFFCNQLRFKAFVSAVKSDRRVSYACTYVTACDFLGFVTFLFLKLSKRIYPSLVWTSNRESIFN